MHSITFTSCVLVAVNILGLVNAKLGINCQGSFFCNPSSSHAPDPIWEFLNYPILIGRVYEAGEHIACQGYICAFYQNTDVALSGVGFHELVTFLYAHGCKMCGSVPVEYPFNNDPDVAGILTVNYVSNPSCSGMC
ncbi:hypothetical protein MMC12_004332 [Toensbergia leucococca]|nr:hypothetical protein [Toensbergia leucococca]